MTLNGWFSKTLACKHGAAYRTLENNQFEAFVTHTTNHKEYDDAVFVGKINADPELMERRAKKIVFQDGLNLQYELMCFFRCADIGNIVLTFLGDEKWNHWVVYGECHQELVVESKTPIGFDIWQRVVIENNWKPSCFDFLFHRAKYHRDCERHKQYWTMSSFSKGQVYKKPFPSLHYDILCWQILLRERTTSLLNAIKSILTLNEKDVFFNSSSTKSIFCFVFGHFFFSNR
jgi:hypothetical protein